MYNIHSKLNIFLYINSSSIYGNVCIRAAVFKQDTLGFHKQFEINKIELLLLVTLVHLYIILLELYTIILFENNSLWYKINFILLINQDNEIRYEFLDNYLLLLFIYIQ